MCILQRARRSKLHYLDCNAVCEDQGEVALNAGIVTMGGGGDFPRNVMCPPLTGSDPDAYFDVLPYAEEAGEYLMNLFRQRRCRAN